MRDWILGLEKAAIEHRQGVSAEDWEQVEQAAGYEAPEALRELYAAMNGATFASGVVLYPLRGSGDARGMAEHNTSGSAGLPRTDVWRFGRKDQEHLAAVRKRRLADIEQREGDPRPDWLDAVSDEAWIYVARDESTNALRLYHTLEQLLSARIPPAESEDFGERTFARAISLVQDAISDLNQAAKSQVEEIVDRVRETVKKGRTALKKKVARVAKKKKKAPAKKRKPSRKPKKVAKRAKPRAAKRARPTRRSASARTRKAAPAGAKSGARKTARRR